MTTQEALQDLRNQGFEAEISSGVLAIEVSEGKSINSLNIPQGFTIFGITALTMGGAYITLHTI